MPANFCLLPQKIAELKKTFKDKKVGVVDLMNMTSEARTEFFSKYAGESAKDINLAFEQKLVLKNKTLGVVNLLKKLTESGKYSPEKVAELNKLKTDFRAAQQERIFSPKEEEKFLDDLAEKAFGTDISQAQAKKLFDLEKQKQTLLEKFDGEKWASDKDRLTYGASAVLETNYTSELKGEGQPFTEIVKNLKDEFKAEPYKPKAVAKLGADALRTITDNSIALVASVDNSFLGRQGINVLMTHPGVWLNGAGNSFANIYKELGGKDAMDALMADILSRPNYINGEYDMAGILAKSEEQFPTSLPEQIPGLGRVFKASEVAFKGSAIQMRTGLYDLYSEMARNGKVKMDKTQIEDIGTVVNSMTARGKWGKYGESPIVKLLLWAPRMIKANLDILTAHGLGIGLKTPFARKEAFKNWVKIVGTLTVTLATINEVLKRAKIGSVEFNPLSSDFGKVVIQSDSKMVKTLGTLTDFIGVSSNTNNGKTTFDITGGKGSYVTLTARQIMNKSKSASTGITKEFGTGFGDQTRFGAGIDFFTGKTTPMVKAVVDFAKGRNFKGQKPTVSNTAYGLLVPISIQNILGIFGVNQDGGTDWGESDGKELNQFKEKVGEDKFQEANQKFNDQVKQKTQILYKSAEYLAKSDENKQKAITKLKADIKKQIFKDYGFSPNK